jgi:hypothetical protein
MHEIFKVHAALSSSPITFKQRAEAAQQKEAHVMRNLCSFRKMNPTKTRSNTPKYLMTITESDYVAQCS